MKKIYLVEDEYGTQWALGSAQKARYRANQLLTRGISFDEGIQFGDLKAGRLSRIEMFDEPQDEQQWTVRVTGLIVG